MALALLPTDTNLSQPLHAFESEEGRWVSEATYWAEYYEHPYFNYEWNNGILEVVPMSDYLQYTLYDWFISLVREFLRINPIARQIALETGFKLSVGSGRSTIRKPDLGIVLNTNLQPLNDTDRSYKGTFDLCIESMSDSSRREVERDTIIKKAEYARAGVTEYYILDPRKKHLYFYRLSPLGVYLPIQPTPDGVIRSQVLPGFQFRLSDLSSQPSPEEMALDAVYRDFMLLEYQKAEQRANQAEQRASQAERENIQLRARLKALGIELPPAG